jgi:spore coat protein CotH
MIEYVKQNVDVIQTSVYHSVLFALEQRDREELDQKKKQDQAKTRATQRASKRKITKTNTITKPCV